MSACYGFSVLLLGVDCCVRAFDFGHVQEACSAADEHATGECELGDALQAAFVQRARAVGDAFAALQHASEDGVVLQALELLVGAEVCVLIVEADHVAHGDLVVFHVVHEQIVTKKHCGKLQDQIVTKQHRDVHAHAHERAAPRCSIDWVTNCVHD